VPDRATPYHRPHSTQLAGYAVIFGGDDRYVGNLFVGGDPSTAYGPAAEGYGPTFGGTAGYDGDPASFEEYLARIDDQPPGDHHRFLAVKQPVYARANAYAAGARPFDGELEPRVLGAATATVVDEGDMVYLITELPDAFDRARIGVVTGRDLERVRCADADFEEADGGPAVMEIDLLGQARQPGGQALSARSPASAPERAERASSESDRACRSRRGPWGGRRTFAHRLETFRLPLLTGVPPLAGAASIRTLSGCIDAHATAP
jgi:hypothetical protein